MKAKLTPYFPGIIIFVLALIIGLFVYKDYGCAWDEPLQRENAIPSYDYIFHGSNDLFTKPTDNHGAGFEVPLLIIEKSFKLTDTHDIYTMRHLVSHLFFLVGMFFGYILLFRLFRNNFIACLGFIALIFAPRLYAHSFFNSKDIPFLAFFLITLAVSQIAFDKNRTFLYAMLGFACGYTTSIRVMGVMLAVFVLLFLLIDIVTAFIDKKKAVKPALNLVVFLVGFCLSLYFAWPYLWRSPIHHFVESYTRLSHFDWVGTVLIGGKNILSTQLPWTYFPTWYMITNPILWLVAGFAGAAIIIREFFKSPWTFIRNTRERNFMLYLMCFFAPIFAVLALHSIIYDDWRHLYFVYPSFLLMGMYAISKAYEAAKGKMKYVVQGVCAVQVLMILVFMVKAHPLENVYFNELVSHEDEYLRKNYELDYWGVGNKQALEYILANDQRPHIKISAIYPEPVWDNVGILDTMDRIRLKVIPPDSCDYFITNFRFHPDDFPYPVEYSINILNSSIYTIYKMKAFQYQIR